MKTTIHSLKKKELDFRQLVYNPDNEYNSVDFRNICGIYGVLKAIECLDALDKNAQKEYHSRLMLFSNTCLYYCRELLKNEPEKLNSFDDNIVMHNLFIPLRNIPTKAASICYWNKPRDSGVYHAKEASKLYINCMALNFPEESQYTTLTRLETIFNECFPSDTSYYRYIPMRTRIKTGYETGDITLLNVLTGGLL